MYSLPAILKKYADFKAKEVTNRFFKHSELLDFLNCLTVDTRFVMNKLGESAQGRSIHIIRFGSGPVRILLWSQMHGNEATATMAMLDLFNVLRSESLSELSAEISRNCSLYFIPMVNPDGAEVFTRRNAMEIDINRDFQHQQSPEGRLLRNIRDEIAPDFGFNLHDQTTMWSAGETGNPATISLLAPACNALLDINPVRQRAMQVIVSINRMLQIIIPDHVARFNDEFEPRAFGDNFQASGTSTILIEAGGYGEDSEKQEIRKYFFSAMFEGILSISNKTYQNCNLEEYFSIPENKLYHFQILLINVKLTFDNQSFKTDIGLTLKETLNEDKRSVSRTLLIGDLGDLSNRFAYKDLDCTSYTLIQTSKFIADEPAHLILMDGNELLLEIENGAITTDNI